MSTKCMPGARPWTGGRTVSRSLQYWLLSLSPAVQGNEVNEVKIVLCDRMAGAETGLAEAR